MKYADYIDEIEIDALWKGRKHIRWHLDPEVNVLSGGNGMGKSTILNRIISGVKSVEGGIPGLRLETMPKDADLVRFDIIAIPDSRLEYDLNLQELNEQYSKYDNAERRELFADIVDETFASTQKHIIRGRQEVELEQWGEPLDLRKLSSGEKHMLCILLTVLLEDQQRTVLFMDEPEASLHMEWQQRLIDTIRRLNPNVQIILTTHSPAIIMDGWMDHVTEVSDITV